MFIYLFLYLIYISFLSFIVADNLNIFWDDFSEETIFHLINQIESQLRIYIYPFPSDSYYLSHLELKHEVLPHFRVELLFKQYLQSYNKLRFLNDSNENYILTTNPDDANLFIIDHQWLTIATISCHHVYHDHLLPIINNVLYNYPYYNRSNGQDHFFFALYDHGPFCHTHCDKDMHIQNALLRISNASFIGNYGMDEEGAKIDGKYANITCHRPHDIVIPQPIKKLSTRFRNYFNNSFAANREFDSTFSGSTWGTREPLVEMKENRLIEYNINHTENFFAQFGGSPEFSLRARGYFMYSPCGFACWSQRLFEAISHYTTPILVSDGTIYPFERLIDWKKISIKMSYKTWFDHDLQINYRQRIRLVADEYKTELYKCWNATGSPYKHPMCYEDYYHFLDAHHDNQNDETWTYNPICSSLHNTFIWKKFRYLKMAAKWFDVYRESIDKLGFRLIEIEMYCRIRKFHQSLKLPEIYEQYIIKICNRSNTHVGRLEYFE